MLIVFSCVLGFILLLSLLKEIKTIAKTLEKLTLVSLFIPSWSFFGPVPGMLDYHIFYREFAGDGEKGNWKQPFQLPDQRPWYTCLWNSDKRFIKAVLDLTQDLLQLSHLSKDKDRICISLSYLHLLNYVYSLPRLESTSKIQFMIVGNSRLQDPDVLFVSKIHSVE